MIIIGYTGIGKSTLARRNPRFVDLESSCFFVNENRAENWYITYCQLAEHLSEQGKIVFVSSHKDVQGYLRLSNETIVCVFPDISLKDEWVNKLRERYFSDKSEKNLKAYKRARDHFEEDIEALDCFVDNAILGAIELKLSTIDYDLETSIVHLINTEHIS